MEILAGCPVDRRQMRKRQIETRGLPFHVLLQAKKRKKVRSRKRRRRREGKKRKKATTTRRGCTRATTEGTPPTTSSSSSRTTKTGTWTTRYGSGTGRVRAGIQMHGISLGFYLLLFND
jgi:hypothetical protein